MKLIETNLDTDNDDVVLVPEEPDDMWHAYNFISVGDSVKTTTVRKVQTEGSVGTSVSYRVKTVLTVKVTTIDYDAQSCTLRLKGRSVEQNKYVKVGVYHTLQLQLNRTFTLKKKHWDSISLERIGTACDPAKEADFAAVIMQEGLAHVCFITPSMTHFKSEIEIPIPRKRRGFMQQHEKALNKFYDTVMQAILRHVNLDLIRCILIASPGFVKDQFFEYMFQTAFETANKLLLENKSKFMLVHSSSGFKYSLNEVLQDPRVMAKLSDTKASDEAKVLETFYAMLRREPGKAFYGRKHVEKAIEWQAVDTLLISDNLFRSQDAKLRDEYVDIVERVRKCGGDVKIFSSLHVTGEQLELLTGIAAILRFPMPELEDEESDED